MISTPSQFTERQGGQEKEKQPNILLCHQSAKHSGCELAGLRNPDNVNYDENGEREISFLRNSLCVTKDFLLLLQRLGNLFSKHSLSSPHGCDVAKSQGSSVVRTVSSCSDPIPSSRAHCNTEGCLLASLAPGTVTEHSSFSVNICIMKK